MFYPNRIISIKNGDRVLEVGPGAEPYFRSDVLLEKRFDSEAEAFAQRGELPLQTVDNRTVFYDGNQFPFKDLEFDYVICSHVVEHVEDVDQFVTELCRVAKAGYLEFPLPLYEYLYNIPEHCSFVLYDGKVLKWLPKKLTRLDDFFILQRGFREALRLGYSTLVDQLSPNFIMGFEWSGRIETKRVNEMSALLGSDSFESMTLLSESDWGHEFVTIKAEELKRLHKAASRLTDVGFKLERITASRSFRFIQLCQKLLGRNPLPGGE